MNYERDRVMGADCDGLGRELGHDAVQFKTVGEKNIKESVFWVDSGCNPQKAEETFFCSRKVAREKRILLFITHMGHTVVL